MLCKCPAIYSGHITAQQGFSAPTSFDGPAGWTVFKQNQTEIYIVTHNLGLANPEHDLHIVATPKEPYRSLFIAAGPNSFTVQCWQMWAGVEQAPAPSATDFMFVAVRK